MGERNHPIFWWYLLAELALCVWTFTFSIAEFTGGTAADMKQCLLPAIVACPLFALLLLGLLCTHSSFALLNRTTFESVSGAHLRYLRGRERGARSPFDRGACFNLAAFCCACVRPAPVDWAELLAEERGAPGDAGAHASSRRPRLRRPLADALGLRGALSPHEERGGGPGGSEARGRAAGRRGAWALCAGQMELV